MRLLLDTHILIWSLNDSPKLPKKARELMVTADEVYASVINIWEMVIKHSIGKLKMNLGDLDLLDVIRASGYEMLNIKPEHSIKLLELETFHKDPFDRMLISQSIVEPLHLITCDSIIAQYKANVIKV